MTGQAPDDAPGPGDAPDASSGPDRVARNRATPRRRVPGRDPTGWHVTRRWLYLTAAVLIAATGVLIAILATAPA